MGNKSSQADEDIKEENLDKETRESLEEQSEDVDAGYGWWDRDKTFKPIKKHSKKHEKLHTTIQATMKATLGGGALLECVRLPEGEMLEEWIAVNTIHFYNAANMVYGACTDFCTDDKCPVMNAGSKYEYLWKDETYKKPARLSAPMYIGYMLNWVNDRISDPELFPVDDDVQFPRDFMKQVKVIYKRLFRLYAHIYYAHFEDMRNIGANAHLNTCFKHFVFFVKEFDLVEENELAPLKKLIDKFANAQASAAS